MKPDTDEQKGSDDGGQVEKLEEAAGLLEASPPGHQADHALQDERFTAGGGGQGEESIAAREDRELSEELGPQPPPRLHTSPAPSFTDGIDDLLASSPEVEIDQACWKNVLLVFVK